jgi:serpin B
MTSARIAAATVVAGLLLAACAAPPDATDGRADGDTEPEPADTKLAALDVERPAPNSPDAADLAAGLNDVGYRLFAAAAAESADDLVLSPLSIGVAFGMADAGASGETAQALADLFVYPVEGEARWQAFNTLEQDVTDVGGPVVRLANRQFPDTDFATVDGYDERLATYFGARVEPLPLKADSEGSRARINDWVAEQTEDLIPDLVPPGLLGPDSELVLVNALYLEADWALPFGKYGTEDADFTRLDGSTVTVPLMHELELRGPAVTTDTYAATEIPYEGNELSMLVVVPAEGRYADVEAQLAEGLVDEIDAAATGRAVELFLPRFESDGALDLRPLIEGDLGVTGIFGAGYDGIAPGITLESAVHAADIAVDEQGTVAAAATALEFPSSGPPEPEVTVRADRPFLYLIRHRPTGAVLFLGRVLDPSA